MSESYKDKFNAAMKKFGINSLDDLKTDADKKKFFNHVDSIHTADHEEVKEGIFSKKIQYAYLRFRNKNEANRAARTAADLAGHNTQFGKDIEIEVSSGGAGENLTIDGGKNDVSKIVKELVRLYRPKVLEKESLDKSVKEKMGANTPSNPNRYKQYLKRTGQKLSNELTPKQKMLDKDKDGDIGADDLAKLRATKKESVSSVKPEVTVKDSNKTAHEGGDKKEKKDADMSKVKDSPKPEEGIKKATASTQANSAQPFNQTENKKYLQTKPGSLEEAVLISRGLNK